MKRVVMLRYNLQTIPCNSLKRYDDRPSAVQQRRRLRKRQFKAESTRIHFCLKADIFFSGFASCPHVFGFSFTCGGTKTEDFEYDDVVHHMLLTWRMLRKGCYRIYIVLAFSCGRAKTIRIRYVRMRFFFKRRKTSPFSKISGYVWPGPKCDYLALLQTYLFYFFQVVKC